MIYYNDFAYFGGGLIPVPGELRALMPLCVLVNPMHRLVGGYSPAQLPHSATGITSMSLFRYKARTFGYGNEASCYCNWLLNGVPLNK